MTETLRVHILDEIPFEPDIPWLMRRLRIKEGSRNHAELLQMMEKARPIARPRVVYLESLIRAKGEDWVEIDGSHFNSRVLRVNLDKNQRVFPFVASCGPELQEWSSGLDDMLFNFWAEAVKEAALFCAMGAFTDDLHTRYGTGHTAMMNPGSLEDWPIKEQLPLFQLFGDYPAEVGVRLTDSFLMMPTKTVSGICFETEADFESCELCPREGCPGRRAIYNPGAYDSRYCKQNGLPQDHA